MANLERLFLNGTKITDAGLPCLYGLAKLQAVYLGDTRVTVEGVKKLQEALPNCEIDH
jgi:hypothetical protein